MKIASLLNRYIAIVLLLAPLALPAYAQDAAPEDRQPGGGGDAMGWMAGGRGVHGTITAISGTTLTIKTDEGESYQVFTSANTRVMKERQPVKTTEIHVGEMIAAGGEMDAKARTVGAVFVAVFTPEQAAQAKKMRADFGKTWTAGQVIEIKDLSISIKRMDNVAQTFTVDENTSFKKHRESVTLADIQVGDRVAAQGAVKDGVFVATIVTVGRMGGPGEGRRPSDGRGANQPPSQQ